MFIVATICNNSLDLVEEFKTWEQGLTRANEIVVAKLGRSMTKLESAELIDNDEFYCDEDESNVWSVSFGVVTTK